MGQGYSVEVAMRHNCKSSGVGARQEESPTMISDEFGNPALVLITLFARLHVAG